MGGCAHSKPMNFSLFFFAAENQQDSAKKYDLLLEGAKFADENGFSGIWIPERHFNSFGGRFPNPSVAAAAVAAVTKNIKIRAGSVVLPLQDPVRVAEEWSMVDHLSSGRVEVGVASGWAPNDFIFFPENYKNRQDVMWENLEIVKGLWRGNPCIRKNGNGEDFQVSIFPRPLQESLPIWVAAAGSEETFRRAGAAGAGLVTNSIFQSLDKLRHNIAVYYDAWEGAGLDPDEASVAYMVHTFVGDNLKFVKNTVRQPLIDYVSYYTDLLAPTQSSLNIDKASNFLSEMVFQRFFKKTGLFGSPEGCAGKVQLLKEIGITEVSCLIDFGVASATVISNLHKILELKNIVSRK